MLSTRDLYFDIHSVLGSEEELIQNGYLIDVSDRCVDLDLSTNIFVKRVDQFLKNFPGTKIDSFFVNFSLNCEQSSTIDQWISFVFARGVEKINLRFLGRPFTPHPNPSKRYKFSSDLFSDTNIVSNNLKHLSLECCDIVCHPTDCDFEPFKNLRSISLSNVQVDEIFIESLLSNCGLLEELCLVACEFKSSIPKIVSSALSHLNVSNCYKVINNAQIDVNLMSVNCPKLTSLECPGKYLSTTLNIYAHELKKVNFSILYKEDFDAFALCATFPQLEIMRLEIFPMVSTSLQITQPFKYLKQLDFFIYFNEEEEDSEEYEEFDLMLISNILQVSPLLQKLSIMIANPRLFENQKDIKDVEAFSHDEIKVIEFGGCVGNWFEIEFVVNVLKYAQNLEQIVVSPYWREDDSSDWNHDTVWFQSGREKMSEKLKGEGVVGREKIVLM